MNGGLNMREKAEKMIRDGIIISIIVVIIIAIEVSFGVIYLPWYINLLQSAIIGICVSLWSLRYNEKKKSKKR